MNTSSKPYDEIIKAHYQKEAEGHGADETSTMADRRVRDLETDFVLTALTKILGAAPSTASVCDVGCGNGYTLHRISERLPNTSRTGVEFTPELHAIAEQRFCDDDQTRVVLGDVRQPLPNIRDVDVLICQRVLINLLDSTDQTRALGHLTAAVRPHGHLIFIEAFRSGLASLNEARGELGLSPLPPAYHNLYLEDDFFDAQTDLQPVEISDCPVNFLSNHYYVSRVFHAHLTPDIPLVRNSHFVNFFSNALREPVGNYSPLRGRIFQKKN